MRLDGFVRFHAERALTRWRARHPRIVNLTPSSGVGIGNLLYFALWAYDARRADDADAWTLRTPAFEPWLEVFPGIRPLLIDPEDVRFGDRRTVQFAQDYHDHTRRSLEPFVATELLPGLAPTPSAELETVTVNVRRGDYYSNPAVRADFGFDIGGYLRIALRGAAAQAPIGQVAVVSDDPDWCRRELAFLADYGTVTFQAAGDGPVANLRQLASARRLVLANSTFSYWGAHLSNGLHRDNHALVWAPGFHSRAINGGRAYQLDPRWSIVTDLPGGWAEK